MRVQSDRAWRSMLLAVLLSASVLGCTVATEPTISPAASSSAGPTASVVEPSAEPTAEPTAMGPGASLAPPSSSPAPTVPLPSDAPLGAEAPIDDTAWALVARLRATTYTQDTTDAAIEALARAGIGTFADTTATEPIVPVDGVTSPMRVLDWQAHALAVQAWGATTFSGQELDTAMALDAEMEDGVPLPSQLLAGYVATADTPGGAMSRALMAGQDLLDPSNLRFPTMAMTFFLSDLATDGGTIQPTLGMPTARTAALGTVCSDVANWVTNAIHRLFDAIKLATPVSLPGKILVGIWNWLVDKGEAFVHKLIGVVTDAVLGQVRLIAAGVAQLVQRVAAFLPYAVTTRTEPVFRFVLPPSGPSQSGVFVATVTAGDLPDWPDVMKDCAGVAQVALANFHPGGAPITWGPPYGGGMQYVYPMIAPAALDEAGQARWSFGTLADGVPPGGAEVDQVMQLDVQVHRPEIEDARSSIADRLHGGLPALIAGFVGQLFAPFLGAIAQRLDALLVARGTASADIVSHEPPDPTPSPSPTATASSRVPAACSLATHAEAETAAGVGLRPGRADTSTLQGLGSGTACIYEFASDPSDFHRAALRIDVVDLGANGAASFRSYKELSGIASGEVPGLGDDNFYTGADPSAQLFVRKGNVAVLFFIAFGTVDKGAALARRALGRF